MLAPEALQRLHRFADEVDGRTPGTLTGVYGVGSLALGDWRGGSSNLDVVAVADRWTPAALQAAGPAVASLHQPHRDGRVLWTTWSDLAADPATVAGQAACVEGRRRLPGETMANPMTWQIMRSVAICTRGPEYPDIGVGELRDWARQQLTGVWPDRVRAWARRPGSLSLRRSAAPLVLEVARLWVIVGSGRILSKREAADVLIDGATPPQQRILRDALGWREGVTTSMYWGPFERKHDAIAWMRATVEAAAAA